jgi:hypothetical protein
VTFDQNEEEEKIVMFNRNEKKKEKMTKQCEHV